jgi:cytochrome P450
VRGDAARVRPTIEEALRFHPPFRSGRRLATREARALGVDLAAGDTVYLARQAATATPSASRIPTGSTRLAVRPAT